MKAESFEIGSVIAGTYKILEFIGQGGMGQVFKVEHLVLAKIQAMKILRQEQVSTEVWQRFRTEAQAIARVDHPNIIKIFDMSQTASGLPFYTMEYLAGQSLADHLSDVRRVPVQEALLIFEQVCNGLGYAHDRGIIHRDIKPGNIMILHEGDAKRPQVKIVDFGIAKLLSYDTNVGQALTRPGEVFGSPLYMSPEQAHGQKVDYRTDMYSVGVTMFQVLTGRPPLLGKSAIETVALHQSAPPPALKDMAPDIAIPPDLELIVQRLLSKDPEQRYLSFYDVAEELKTLAQGKRLTREANAARAPQALVEEGVDTTFGDNKRQLFIYIPLTVLVLLTLAGTYWYWDQQRNHAEKDFKLKTLYDEGVLLLHDKSDLDAAAVKVDKKGDAYDQEVRLPEADKAEEFLAKNKKMYSTIYKVNGEEYRRFEFPSDFALGKIIYSLGDRRSAKYVKAQGVVKVPLKARLRLDASPVTKAYYDLLQFFGANELQGLGLNHVSENRESMVQNLSRLTGLQVLDLHYADITDSDLNWLEKMPSLARLTVSKTNVTAKGLAASKLMSRLAYLEIEHMENISPVLKALEKSQNIRHLSMACCDPTTDDYRQVARITHLKQLNLRDNKMSNQDIVELTKLDLEKLILKEVRGLNAKVLSVFPRFKNMKRLVIPVDNFTPEQIAKLQKAMPRTIITINDKDY